jgi:dTDP-4-dehydrorhamnose 3,5-epimerase
VKIAVASTPLEGVVIIDAPVFGDERGFFMESWNERAFAAAGLPHRFVQDSHSRSTRGVLRGLHYQDMTAPMGKLVRCTVGAIFDAVVDLRVGSATLGRWYGLELTAENKRQIYIPPGFAHGFQTLTDAAEVQYKQTEFYTPPSEGTIAWNDPDIGIVWPIPSPILSNRDQRGMSLKDYLARPSFRYSQPT